jgi:hypothetical protein
MIRVLQLIPFELSYSWKCERSVLLAFRIQERLPEPRSQVYFGK